MGILTSMVILADAISSVGHVLWHGLGNPKYAPCPLLRQYVQAGRLGRKTPCEL